MNKSNLLIDGEPIELLPSLNTEIYRAYHKQRNLFIAKICDQYGWTDNNKQKAQEAFDCEYFQHAVEHLNSCINRINTSTGNPFPDEWFDVLHKLSDLADSEIAKKR